MESPMCFPMSYWALLAHTGNPATVSVSATGSEASINLNLIGKGTGLVQWYVQCNGNYCDLIANGTGHGNYGGSLSHPCGIGNVSATVPQPSDIIIATLIPIPRWSMDISRAQAEAFISRHIQPANNVNFKLCNNTSSSITPAALTFIWRVLR